MRFWSSSIRVPRKHISKSALGIAILRTYATINVPQGVQNERVVHYLLLPCRSAGKHTHHECRISGCTNFSRVCNVEASHTSCLPYTNFTHVSHSHVCSTDCYACHATYKRVPRLLCITYSPGRAIVIE